MPVMIFGLVARLNFKTRFVDFNRLHWERQPSPFNIGSSRGTNLDSFAISSLYHRIQGNTWVFEPYQ